MRPATLALLLLPAAAGGAPREVPGAEETPAESPEEAPPRPERGRLRPTPSRYSGFEPASTKAGVSAPAPAPKPAESEVKVPLTPFLWPGGPQRRPADREDLKDPAPPPEPPAKLAGVSIVMRATVRGERGSIACDEGAWREGDGIDCFPTEAACVKDSKGAPCNYRPAMGPVAIKCLPDQKAHRVSERLGMCCDPRHWTRTAEQGCFDTKAECETKLGKACHQLRDEP